MTRQLALQRTTGRPPSIESGSHTYRPLSLVLIQGSKRSATYTKRGGGDDDDDDEGGGGKGGD